MIKRRRAAASSASAKTGIASVTAGAASTRTRLFTLRHVFPLLFVWIAAKMRGPPLAMTRGAMPHRLPASLFLVLVSCLFGCADLAHEPLRATRDEKVSAPPNETPAPPIEAHADALELALVVDVAGEPLVVLPGEPDESWSSGEATLVTRGDLYVARREVALDQIPLEVQQRLGEKLALFDDHGRRCTAVVDGLTMIVRADPRMDTRDEWDGKGSSGATKKATPAEVATDVWSMNGPQLMAHVHAIEGTCAGATFARSRLLGEPIVVPATAADPTTMARALAFARTTPTFVDIQAGYAAEPKIPGDPPRPARWDASPYTAKNVVTMRVGQASYTWISIATEGGCGDFNARYGALLREDPAKSGGFVVVYAAPDGVMEQPRALVDFGDGAPTMMFENAVLRAEAGTYRYDSQTVWSMECPC